MEHVQIFLDETYPKKGNAELVAVAAVASPKSSWPRYAEELRAMATLGERRRLAAIRDFVADRGLLAVIAGTRLDLVGATPKSRDEFLDVGSLSRRDMIWVQTLGSAAALLTRKVLEGGWRVDQFNLFYDPKTLAKEHQELVEGSIPKVIEKECTILAQYPVSVGTIQAIPKTEKGVHNDLSEGTQLAHWIAKLPNRYTGNVLLPTIEVCDVQHYFT
jgi:hypothetical protein